MSCRPRTGFTLVEVLVAMAILALAGVAVLKGMDENRSALLASTDMTSAGMLAAGKLDQIIAEHSFDSSSGRFPSPDERFGFIVECRPRKGGLTTITVQVYEGGEDNIVVVLEQLAASNE